MNQSCCPDGHEVYGCEGFVLRCGRLHSVSAERSPHTEDGADRWLPHPPSIFLPIRRRTTSHRCRPDRAEESCPPGFQPPKEGGLAARDRLPTLPGVEPPSDHSTNLDDKSYRFPPFHSPAGEVTRSRAASARAIAMLEYYLSSMEKFMMSPPMWGHGGSKASWS